MKKAIIVDIDGTLADIEHRVHYLQSKPKKNWKSFYQEVDKDIVNPWCLEIIMSMKASGYQIILLTGREEICKEKTLKWLEDNKIPYDLLYMRPLNDFRADDVIKCEIYYNEIEKKFQTLFVLEDRKTVVEMWRKEGITCLQCEWGEF